MLGASEFSPFVLAEKLATVEQPCREGGDTCVHSIMINLLISMKSHRVWGSL